MSHSYQLSSYWVADLSVFIRLKNECHYAHIGGDYRYSPLSSFQGKLHFRFGYIGNAKCRLNPVPVVRRGANAIFNPYAFLCGHELNLVYFRLQEWFNEYPVLARTSVSYEWSVKWYIAIDAGSHIAEEVWDSIFGYLRFNTIFKHAITIMKR